MWDSVPWMVGGGAEHSTNVARNVAHAAFGGLEGIVGARDLEVRELAVPGTSVRVFPGTAAIQNQATGVRDEMYVGRLPSQDTVPIASTDSTGGRSDLIVARVENPHLAGEPWNAPADPTTGPYIYTRVISGVSATSQGEEIADNGYSAIPLARIDLPASTGTITQSMITDLRRLAQKQSHREFNLIAPSADNQLTGSSFNNWPSEMNMDVDVPSWATHAKVRALLGGVRFGAAGDNGGNGWNIYGRLRIQLGGALATYSQATAFNLSNGGGFDLTTLMAGAPSLYVDPGLRGRAANLKVEGRIDGGNGATVRVNAGSMLSLEVEFVNAAEANT